MKRSVKTKQSLASLRFLLQRAINLGGGAVVKSFHIFFLPFFLLLNTDTVKTIKSMLSYVSSYEANTLITTIQLKSMELASHSQKPLHVFHPNLNPSPFTQK